jgi:hypothetical protein
MIRSTLWLATALAACGDSSPGLIIDMSNLMIRKDALDLPVERLTVSISGPHAGEVQVEVTPDDPVFELSPLTSGPLYIEGLAEDENGIPSYYGDLRVVLPPSGTAEVVLPMFPAGRIDVSVDIASENEPEIAVVTFAAAERSLRPDQSRTFDATFVSRRLTRVLPSGFYTFRAQVSFDGGQSYEAIGPTSLEIEIPANGLLAETLDLTNI